MRKNVLIFGGIAAIIGFFIYTKANAGKKVLITFKSLKVGGDLLSPKIIITLILENPTNQNFNIKSIVGTVFINNESTGTINLPQKTVLNKNSSQTLDLSVRLNLYKSFTVIKNIIKNKGYKTVVARVQGNANVDGIVVPFNEIITL